MIAAGYEDGNDASSLRDDPMFKIALDLTPSAIASCVRNQRTVGPSYVDQGVGFAIHALEKVARPPTESANICCACYHDYPRTKRHRSDVVAQKSFHHTPSCSFILTLRDRQAAVKPLCTQTQVYPRNPTFGGCLSMTITFEMKALTFRT